jgi:hypothetical protein
MQLTAVCSGLLGAAIGALAAYLTARFVWRAALQQYAVTMIPFCSAWLAVWAWRLNWRQNEGLTRVPADWPKAPAAEP